MHVDNILLIYLNSGVARLGFLYLEKERTVGEGRKSVACNRGRTLAEAYTSSSDASMAVICYPTHREKVQRSAEAIPCRDSLGEGEVEENVHPVEDYIEVQLLF